MSNVIIGMGSYLPERVVTNDDLQAMVKDFDPARSGGKSLDEWARQQHGAVSRRWVQPGKEATSDLATEAARRALAEARLPAGSLDLIVLATFTSDCRLPQAAGLVQANLGAPAKFVQLDAACSGFVDSLLVGNALMETYGYENALIIGADTMSAYLDPHVFMPLTVFGDGAGAVVLQSRPELPGYGMRSFSVGSDGDLGHYVHAPGGGGRVRISQGVVEERSQYLRFKFREINRWAVDRMSRCSLEAIERAGLKVGDIRWVVPHQASSTLLAAVARRIGVAPEAVIDTYPETGNISAGSIPVALDRAKDRQQFADGDWVLMPAVGAGMAWGAVTYRWFDYKKGRDSDVVDAA